MVEYCFNPDLETIVTPVKADVLEKLLIELKYCKNETKFLVDGFCNGFDIGYQGSHNRQDTSDNIPITVGSKQEMWDKLMKEVKAGRYTGPFDKIPFEKYVQSPIGLVLKAGGKTRLIFHLSYQFRNGNPSINQCTPAELCSVKYNDLDDVIRNCFSSCKEEDPIFFSKTDVQSAFRILPLKIGCIKWLIMMAVNPTTGEKCYFVEKCLPFGSSISCSHFQRFSNALRHIHMFRTGQSEKKKATTNYLDDFIFLARFLHVCNWLVQTFLQICSEVGVPIVNEKTVWGCNQIMFLGMLLNGVTWTISVPLEKVNKAVNLLKGISQKKKATIKQLQQLAGLLNFLNQAIFPGRAFTRRMYAKFTGKSIQHLKPYHHVKLDREFKEDCKVWLRFLDERTIQSVSRPFVDLSQTISAEEIGFSTDSAGGALLGFGCLCTSIGEWCYAQWEENFIKEFEPSIEFLELFALCVGIHNWIGAFANRRISVLCDNELVVSMINQNSSSCKYCMQLIRQLVLKCLQFYVRIFARHLAGKLNLLPDLLSRMKIKQFHIEVKKLNLKLNKEPTHPSTELWPLKSWWLENCSSL